MATSNKKCYVWTGTQLMCKDESCAFDVKNPSTAARLRKALEKTESHVSLQHLESLRRNKQAARR